MLVTANILVRYLGEQGSKTPIAAAVSMCNPFDLVRFFLSHSVMEQLLIAPHGNPTAAAWPSWQRQDFMSHAPPNVCKSTEQQVCIP